MRKIAALAEEIHEELCDAEKYAEKYLKAKDPEPDSASVYAQLAREELSHANLLHGLVAKAIKAYTATGKEAPQAMQAVWDYEHDKLIEQEKEVRMMLTM